ncbi:8-oxo-dGTPase [Acinetobacter calcoaceticus]|uniref:8-oxo-dGTP diphosphatase n=1 Tax=Acinetobacter calcoaceticus TaxID=471 RepID=A0A4R1XUN0_ACICA|nr:8-oxo-dGTPase [Acinetobacter calcoaceticus]
MIQQRLDIAIGLIFYQGKVLVGWRTAKQHQGNKYEFPGGKVESGETALQACRREIKEEVGLDLELWHPVDVIAHVYPDLAVHLHVFHSSIDAQQLASITAPWTWYSRQQLPELNFPAANQSIIQRLLWPHFIKISTVISDLALLQADHLLYWRIDPAEFDPALLLGYSESQLQQLMLNIECWRLLSQELQAQVKTIHLKQHQLLAAQPADIPRLHRVIAACHDQVAIAHAQQVGVEAILLSPVHSTATHLDAAALGWGCFAQWASQVQIPVYALGGMQKTDLQRVQAHHGYGVAGISGFESS